MHNCGHSYGCGRYENAALSCVSIMYASVSASVTMSAVMFVNFKGFVSIYPQKTSVETSANIQNMTKIDSLPKDNMSKTESRTDRYS